MLISCRKSVQNRANIPLSCLRHRLLHRFLATYPQPRPFLLLEILIAFALLLLAAYPLSHIPVAHYSSEMAALERLERQKLADWSCSEVIELLYNRKIPWEKIPGKKGIQKQRIALSETSILLLHKTKAIQRVVSLRCAKEKVDPIQGTFRLLEIEILLTPKLEGEEYLYRRIVQKS